MKTTNTWSGATWNDMNFEERERWCDVRETSMAIAEAIHAVSASDGADPDDVWSDPTTEQESAVLALAWSWAGHSMELYWGAETHRRAV